jgi:hypothetical protein
MTNENELYNDLGIAPEVLSDITRRDQYDNDHDANAGPAKSTVSIAISQLTTQFLKSVRLAIAEDDGLQTDIIGQVKMIIERAGLETTDQINQHVYEIEQLKEIRRRLEWVPGEGHIPGVLESVIDSEIDLHRKSTKSLKNQKIIYSDMADIIAGYKIARPPRIPSNRGPWPWPSMGSTNPVWD